MLPSKADRTLLDACKSAAEGRGHELLEVMKDKDGLKEALQGISKRHLEAAWKFILSAATKATRNRSTGEIEDRKDDCDDEGELNLEVLQGIVEFCEVYMDFKEESGKGKEKKNYPPLIIDTFEVLHSILLRLEGLQGTTIQSRIARMCQVWWTRELPGANRLITQLLPLTMARALEDDGKESDVKRVHVLRQAFLLLDWEDDDSDGLRELLLRAFLSPRFLRSDVGKRFLTCVLGFHTSLVQDVCDVVKVQIPTAPKALLIAYGDIYFRAWHASSGRFLSFIESVCIQPLMAAAAHASTLKLHNAIRVILGEFHEQKLQRGVDAMLLRLYSPILWRGLRSINPSVRARCLGLLSDAFPLQDTDASAAEAESVIQRQFDALSDALEDRDHNVRAAAASATCNILTRWWEAIPSSTISLLLNSIVTRLVWDASSPAVRLASVRGIHGLIQCPLAHCPLRKILPEISNLLHDTDSSVRRQFVGLLNDVKGVRSMRVSQIVSPEHILAQLEEEECEEVQWYIVALIVDSYFPTGGSVTGEEQVSRMLTLTGQNASAAKKLCKLLHGLVGVGAVTKLLVMLTRVVLLAIENGQKSRETIPEVANSCQGIERGSGAISGTTSKKCGHRQKRPILEDESDRPDDADIELSASDLQLMAGLFDLMEALWSSILPQLSNDASGTYKECVDMLEANLSETVLTTIFKTFAYIPKIRPSVLRLLALSDPITSIEIAVTSNLLEMPWKHALDSSLLDPVTNLLCAWGGVEFIVKVLSDIESVINNPATGDLARKQDRRTQQKKKNNLPSKGKGQLHHRVALLVLDSLLRGSTPRLLKARNDFVRDPDCLFRATQVLEIARQECARILANDGDQAFEMRFSTADGSSLTMGDIFLMVTLELRIITHSAEAKGIECKDKNKRVPKGGEDILKWVSSPDILPHTVQATKLSGPAAEPPNKVCHVEMAADSDHLSLKPHLASRSKCPANNKRAKTQKKLHQQTTSTTTSEFECECCDESWRLNLSSGLIAIVCSFATDWLVLGTHASYIENWADRIAEGLLRESHPVCPPLPLPVLCRMAYQICSASTLDERDNSILPDSLLTLLLSSTGHDFEQQQSQQFVVYGAKKMLYTEQLLQALFFLFKRRGETQFKAICKRLLEFIASEASSESNNISDVVLSTAGSAVLECTLK